MSKVNFSLTTSIDETKQLIKSIGTTNTVVVVSEPGVGKSTILEMLKAEMGEDEYDYIYVDCPVKDMMDIAASIPNHESKTLEYYVSSLFKMGNGKKKVIMLDEFMKSPKLMQIIYTRLMLERSVVMSNSQKVAMCLQQVTMQAMVWAMECWLTLGIVCAWSVCVSLTMMSGIHGRVRTALRDPFGHGRL